MLAPPTGARGGWLALGVCALLALGGRAQPALRGQQSASEAQTNQTNQTQTTASGPPPPDFRLVGGQQDLACRGACPSDNDASYYRLEVGVPSLGECQRRCRDDVRCLGVEYNSNGRCELWQRGGGIGATAPRAGYSCYRHSFQPVDGGVDRACRGDSPSDVDGSYYNLSESRSLAECKELCAQTPGCTGIEHTPGGRCEVWKRSIRATAAKAGYHCLAYAPEDPPETDQQQCGSQYSSCQCECGLGNCESDCEEGLRACEIAKCSARYQSCEESCSCGTSCDDIPEPERDECCYYSTEGCRWGCEAGYAQCYPSW